MAAISEAKSINIIENIKVIFKRDSNNQYFIQFEDDELIFLKDQQFYTPYALEILDTYYEDERKLKACIRSRPDIRNFMIEIVSCYAKQKQYSMNTIHLAVLFLDVYMDTYVISEVQEHQKFIALIGLLLAAKSEEQDDKIPSIKDLLNIVDLSEELGIDLRFKNHHEPKKVAMAYKQYLNMYCSIEFTIFESLNFNTIRPTPLSFLGIFQKVIVTESDLNDISDGVTFYYESYGDLKYFANYHLKQLSNILLYSLSFYKYLPSIVAAGMIATVRNLLGIKTIWTYQLQCLTHYYIEEIQPIMNEFYGLLSNLEDNQPETNIDNDDFVDSGYHDVSSEHSITPPNNNN